MHFQRTFGNKSSRSSINTFLKQCHSHAYLLFFDCFHLHLHPRSISYSAGVHMDQPGSVAAAVVKYVDSVRAILAKMVCAVDENGIYRVCFLCPL